MKAIREDKNVISNKLKIFYIIIIAICIISLIAAIVIQITSEEEKENENNTLPQINEEQISKYKQEFNNIFTNKVNYLENNSYKITKIEDDKEIVYLGYQNNENKTNSYELDVNIPYINIQNEQIEKYNKSIKDTFEKKAKNILNAQSDNVIYTVNYSAYVSNNILSVVIRSTLKEGSNAQRDIVQTYNYDLTNKKECTIQEMIEKKGLTKSEVNQKIKEEIKKVQDKVEELEKLGYSIYPRDYESDIYSVGNATEYFMGENNALYIIYAYGNKNYTSEIDIVVM